MKKIVLITVLSLTARFSSVSQEMTTAWDGEPITFGDALYLMFGRNENLEASSYEQQAAEYEMKAAAGLRWPNVGLTGTYMHLSDDIEIGFNGLKQPITHFLGDASAVLPAEVIGPITQGLEPLLARDWAFKLQDKDVGLLGATVTLPIYTGGKINAANNAARIQYREAQEKGETVRGELISELVERYFGLALAREVVEVRNEVVEGMARHLYDAVELEKNGMIARAEVLFVEMKMADAERELNKSIREWSVVNSSLENTLNTPGTYRPVTRMFLAERLPSVLYFQDYARENSPLLKQIRLKKDLAEEGVRLQRSEFLPEVAVLGGYDIYNYQLTKAAPRWAVGVGVSMKIFNGFERENKYRASKLQVKQVESLESKAESDLLTGIETIWFQLKNNEEQIGSINKSLEFATEYLRVKEEAFRAGMAPASDVVDARLNLAQVRTERLVAAYTYDVLLARLLELCGDPEAYVEYVATGNTAPLELWTNEK